MRVGKNGKGEKGQGSFSGMGREKKVYGGGRLEEEAEAWGREEEGWEEEEGSLIFRGGTMVCFRKRMSFTVPPGVSKNLLPTNKYLFMVKVI